VEGNEVSQQKETADSTAPRVSPRRVLYFFTFMGAAMLDIVFLDTALLFGRRSFGYQWLNRIGILLGLILTFGFFFWGQWMSFRRDWDGSHTTRWVFRAFSLIIPVAFVFKAWYRIPDALWLR
jgi:hypothetical protein